MLLTMANSLCAQDAPAGYACENCPTACENLQIEGNNCGGPNQSPIAFSPRAIRGPVSGRLELRYDYESVEPDFTETNIEWATDDSEFAVDLAGEICFFKQFHFHTTAEHVINGERSALEMHFVNKSDSGDALVVAVSIEEGEENENFAPITDGLPGAENAMVNLRSLLPNKLSAYAYRGSTTTPPCSADVEWRLLAKPVELSTQQIGAIRTDIWEINDGFDNNRPIQEREGRQISKTKKANK